MYGFMNYALENLLKRIYGIEKWDEIREKAAVDLEGGSFFLRTIYDDAATYHLVETASKVLEIQQSTLLEMFGEEFFRWCQSYGYDEVLSSLGHSLEDFLSNLDALHDHLSSEYPGMRAPSFRVSPPEDKDVSSSSILLHYYSERAGLHDIVKGIVRSVAEKLYHTPIVIDVLIEDNPSDRCMFLYHTVFSITYVNATPNRRVSWWTTEEAETDAENPVVAIDDVPQIVSNKILRNVFPFHIAFDRKMRVIQAGVSLERIMPAIRQNESAADSRPQLDELFDLARPQLELDFVSVLEHINTVYVLRSRPGWINPDAKYEGLGACERFLEPRHNALRLKGQMIMLPGRGGGGGDDIMLFIASPRVGSLVELRDRGLYLSDVPLHDSTRDLIIKSGLQSAEMNVVHRLELTTEQLVKAQRELEEEKKRTDGLLYSILPVTVADKLRAGERVEAEKFMAVTILFSDIRGFTNICSHCRPIQVVELLNDMYTLFDSQLEKNKAYKVETIGDAYMVVGGLPTVDANHAEHIADQAIDMMECVKKVKHPYTGRVGDVQIRVGIHSGDVMAGVVGVRMPRFCLFGNTVNVASRTESNGIEGKINVSATAHDYLKDNSDYVLKCRGFVEMKGVRDGGMVCYFLESAKNCEATVSRLVMPETRGKTLVELWSRRRARRRGSITGGRPPPAPKPSLPGKQVFGPKRVSICNLELPNRILPRVSKLAPIRDDPSPLPPPSSSSSSSSSSQQQPPPPPPPCPFKPREYVDSSQGTRERKSTWSSSSSSSSSSLLLWSSGGNRKQRLSIHDDSPFIERSKSPTFRTTGGSLDDGSHGGPLIMGSKLSLSSSSSLGSFKKGSLKYPTKKSGDFGGDRH